MDPNAGIVVLPSELKLEVPVPVVSRPGYRSPAALNAVGTYLATQPRYVRRDVDADGHPDTLCNFLVREGLRMLGVDMPRLKANDFASYFRSPDGLAAGWSWEPLWAARELAERGCPVVPIQENPAGHGHVALLQAASNDAEYREALERQTAWICQAGAFNFAHGLLLQGFSPALPIVFFAHP